MTSTLAPLVGRSITSAEVIHDYLQLRFDGGDVLNVYNDYVVEGDGPTDAHALIGLRVSTLSGQVDGVRIGLGARTLVISLREAAYRGPEALEYIPSLGHRVVW